MGSSSGNAEAKPDYGDNGSSNEVTFDEVSAGDDGVDGGDSSQSQRIDGSTTSDRRSRFGRLSTNGRALAAGAVICGALSIFSGGLTLGWMLAGWREVEVTGPQIIEVPIPQYDPETQVSMPDVRGLAQAEAEAVLADVGIPASTVKLSSREAAGTPGIVVEQLPQFGAKNPGTVELLVSAPATVPESVGKSEQEAADALIALGTRVDTTARYVPGTEPGRVVEVSPAAGEPLGESVTLVISEPASSVFLGQLDTIRSRCSGGRVPLNGVDYQNSVSCTAYPRPELAEWLLDRAATELVGTLGVPDDGPADAVVSIRLLADGAEVGAYSASYGAPVPFRVPVAGALRLGIEVTAVNQPQRTSGSWVAVLGDARVEGSSAALASLRDQP